MIIWYYHDKCCYRSANHDHHSRYLVDSKEGYQGRSSQWALHSYHTISSHVATDYTDYHNVNYSVANHYSDVFVGGLRCLHLVHALSHLHASVGANSYDAKTITTIYARAEFFIIFQHWLSQKLAQMIAAFYLPQ